MRAAAFAALIGVAACSVRAPAPIDVLALTRAQGSEGAHRELVARVLAQPRDVQARLGLAALAEQLGRPSEAIAQLEAVAQLGGPAGVRWHDDDRARLARLLHARAVVRLARGAASALDDLQRAVKLGEVVAPDELVHARVAAATAQLRHADALVRDDGRHALAALARTPGANPAWVGASPHPAPDARAAFGIWLWSVGARRAAYDELAAWHDAMLAREHESGGGGRIGPGTQPRDPDAQAAYLRALAWWSPLWLGEVAGPPPSELAGPETCRFPGACRARDAIAGDAERALAGSPAARTADPADAIAWMTIALRGALRGEAEWGATVRARVDATAALADPQLPDDARALLARLTGAVAARGAPATATAALPSLLAGAARVLAGANAAEVRLALDGEATTPEGVALVAMVETAAPIALDAGADLRAAAVARYVRTRVADAPDDATLIAIARAYRVDATSGERRARDAVAAAADDASASAATGALFEALDDPARARAAWQVAADASREPAYLEGLAEATAKANDPDAALISGTAAAAASGDPAATWVGIARALVRAGAVQQGMTAARSAIDLAGPDALPEALELAIAASRVLGRDAQVADLVAKRARLAPAPEDDSDVSQGADPTDAASARAAHARAPSAATLARLWVASRWNPRDAAARVALARTLPADDPRLRIVQLELVALAGDPDPARALIAVQALP